MLVSHGVDVTYESIRQWCLRFGAEYAKRIRARAGRQGDTWHLDDWGKLRKGKGLGWWEGLPQVADYLTGILFLLAPATITQPWIP